MVVESLLIAGVLSASYKVGKVIARTAGLYPSKEVEKKTESLQTKVDILMDYYKGNQAMISKLEELTKELDGVNSEEDYIKAEGKVDIYWKRYNEENL